MKLKLLDLIQYNCYIDLKIVIMLDFLSFFYFFDRPVRVGKHSTSSDDAANSERDFYSKRSFSYSDDNNGSSIAVTFQVLLLFVCNHNSLGCVGIIENMNPIYNSV